MLSYSGKINPIEELEKAYSVTLIKLKDLEQEVSRLQQENAMLKEQLLLLQQQKFGKSSEINVGENIIPTTEKQTISVTSYTRKKAVKSCGRTIDTSNLARYKIYYELDNEHRNCPDCANLLEKVGEDSKEQLEVLPMRLYVVEHIRCKYACRPCQSIIMAPKPLDPIPKCLAGGSLLTEVIVSKYQYHLPLYRQAKIFASLGSIIPDNTLGNWVMQAGDGLMPTLGKAMWDAAVESDYLQVDETPIKLLAPNKKGYLWAYLATNLGKGLVVFELSASRSGSIAETRLAKFKGLLQTDGYAGYQNLRKRQDITGLGCLTHCRRKFADVLKITQNNQGIAAEFMSRVAPLYALEEKMRNLNCSFHSRKRLRQKQAWPIVKALHNWLRQQAVITPPKSKLGQAIQYSLNQWRYMVAYLRHGKAQIDTNYVENEIRPIALGRRNWLFMKNEKSGAVNAFWHSLVSSAVLNQINPRIYIHFLLMHTHALRQGKVDARKLLPHTIDKQLLVDFANSQIAIGKKIFDSS